MIKKKTYLDNTRALEIRNARTFGQLAQAKLIRGDGQCSFCKQFKQDCMKYSTRHSICERCLEPRRADLLPTVAKAESQARTMARNFARSVGSRPFDFTVDELAAEVRSIAVVTGCFETYAQECLDSAIDRARLGRRRGGTRK